MATLFPSTDLISAQINEATTRPTMSATGLTALRALNPRRQAEYTMPQAHTATAQCMEG